MWIIVGTVVGFLVGFVVGYLMLVYQNWEQRKKISESVANFEQVSKQFENTMTAVDRNRKQTVFYTGDHCRD